MSDIEKWNKAVRCIALFVYEQSYSYDRNAENANSHLMKVVNDAKREALADVGCLIESEMMRHKDD